MVQEFMILRCFSCSNFQVHQVKKSKKWVCKVCGEKQSIKKVYGQGSGLDCRKNVQKLNMAQGEAQKVKDLAHNSIENPGSCNFSENTSIDDNVENSEAINCDNQKGVSKEESKWGKFLEISSIDDNGSEEFDGFQVTTERDIFDKALSRGKRKSIWQHGKSRTGFQGKRSKYSTSEDSIGVCDENLEDSDNITGNTTSCVEHLPKKSGPRLKNSSAYNTVNNHNSASKQVNEYQSYNNSLSVYGELQPNAQNNPYKCNIYFAKATRDPSSTMKKMTSHVLVDQDRETISSSKWTKFMPSSLSQTNSHENVMENNPQSRSFVSDSSLENRNCNFDSTVLSNLQQDSESLHSQTNSSIKAVPDTSTHINVDNSKSSSLLVQDLFKVDEDLDEEWWNFV